MDTDTRRRSRSRWAWLAALIVAVYVTAHVLNTPNTSNYVPLHAEATLARCSTLHDVPTPPDGRCESSDRYVPGTKPYLIRNATIWTGAEDGKQVLSGDVLLDKGLIQAIGRIPHHLLDPRELLEVDAQGAWLTPGILDMHSHMGNGASPGLEGAADTNSFKGPILPWLRSIDGINTHDDSYRLSIAGGITTALILPGSANAIAGEAYSIKLRSTYEHTPSSMLVDAPPQLNGTRAPLRWRHMKHACGENPRGAYRDTRMDTVWRVRQAYEKARRIKQAQDNYCSAALAGTWETINGHQFPDDLQWEPLVAILRGQVKAQVHCYEPLDIDNFVRLSNEFRFPVAAFHHAHSAYLVPDVLRDAYGGPPAVAIFASFARYKREAYRHSQYAPRILADQNISVIMKSDHLAISRTLLHEAQQAHYYGLPDHLALASITSVPAKTAGLDWRLGTIARGLDADIVLWDSHPLSLGATPSQVFIDGIPQLEGMKLEKPAALQAAPKTPKFSKEAKLAVKHDGLPPLEISTSSKTSVVFVNVSTIWTIRDGQINRGFSSALGQGTVLVNGGRIICSGQKGQCAELTNVDTEVIDLKGGSVSPGIVTAGANIGLGEILMEPSTTDGAIFNPLRPVPAIIGGDEALIQAVDGLQFATRDALLAYRAGVVAAVSFPQGSGMLHGLSVALSPGASSGTEDGAIIQTVAALHVSISQTLPYSVSTQIGVLRRLLLHPSEGERGRWFAKAASGDIPLVVHVHSADIMATLLQLKADVERKMDARMRMTFLGGAEAHLLARELVGARVGVVLTPPRTFPSNWEQRRILAGPPLTAESAITYLVRHNVTIALGPQGVQGELNNWAVQNLRWDAGWAALESNGTIDTETALTLVSSNVQQLMGLTEEPDLVATEGGDLLSFEGRVKAIISKRRGVVDVL